MGMLSTMAVLHALLQLLHALLQPGMLSTMAVLHALWQLLHALLQPGILSTMAVLLYFTTGVLLCTTVCYFTILSTVALESRRYSTLACYLFNYCLLLYYCVASIQILHELHLLVFFGGGADLRQGAEIFLFLFVV